MKWRQLLCLVVVLSLAWGTALAYSVDDAEGTVVRVYVEWSHEREQVVDEEEGLIFDILGQSGSWTGSAFAVGEQGEPVEYFVTNKHVVEETSTLQFDVYSLETQEYLESGTVKDWPVKIDGYYLVYENTDTMVSAQCVARSDRADLAVLSPDIPTNKRTAAILRPFDLETMKKESIYALGFPGVADNSVTGEAREKLDSTQVFRSDGVISTFLTHEKTQVGELLQMTTPINGGNSGGPVVDANGYVLGVSTSTYLNVQNVNMAVTVNEVIRMLDQAEIPYTTVEEFTGTPEQTPTEESDIIPSEGETSTDGGKETQEGPDEGGEKESNSTVYYVVGGAAIGIGVVLLLLRRAKHKSAGEKPGVQPVTRTLIGEQGALTGQRFTLKAGQTVIGRDPKVCQIVVPADTKGVSHAHCTITVTEDGKVTVRDDGSRYGTWLDNTKLPPNEENVFHRGHRIYLGSREQSFILRS